MTSHLLCQCHKYLSWFCSSAMLQNSCNPIIAMITSCDDRHCHSCQTVAQSMGRARSSCWQCQQQYSCFWSYRFQDRSLAQHLYVSFTHQLWSLPDLSCRSIWSPSLIVSAPHLAKALRHATLILFAHLGGMESCCTSSTATVSFQIGASAS